MEEKDKKEEKLGEALMKVALGYQLSEVTEEYAEVDGALKLTKRKKTKKDVPPDLKAVQMLLTAENGTEYGGWTDEELEAEKQRLLAALQENSEKKTTVKRTVKKSEKSENDGDRDALNTKKPRPKPRKRVVRKK